MKPIPGSEPGKNRNSSIPIKGLEKKLEYRFHSGELLIRALTHSSRANEEGLPGQDNELLEFLGDSVLSFVLTEILFRTFPDLLVGELSRLRAHLVNRESLARRANRLGLGKFLRFGKSEGGGSGARNPSMLADGYEAVLAAIFLDGGLDPARRFLEREFNATLSQFRRGEFLIQDPKSELQELLQDRGKALPAYRLESATGPPHDRSFAVTLLVGGKVLGRGLGRTKKAAERMAAGLGLERLAGKGFIDF